MAGAAYTEAKSGGRHGGWYKDQLGLGQNQLRKGIKSLAGQIEKHEKWIANPSAKVTDWLDRDHRYKAGLIRKWESDVSRQREQLDILQGILEEKTNGRI